jgi:hypothetical protein
VKARTKIGIGIASAVILSISIGTGSAFIASSHAATARPAVAVKQVAPSPTKTIIKVVHPRRHHHAAAPAAAAPAPAPAAPAPQFTNSSAVVAQFYQDITDHNYAAAWTLGGDNIGGSDYNSWVAGYDTTVSISLSNTSLWDSGQVHSDLSALQSDGTVKTYTGTYTVSNGVIVGADIVQTS